MLNSQVKSKKVADIGAEIGSELANKFLEDFKSQNVAEEPDYFLIGKKILTAVISQPGCEGLKLCNALNEEGERTLVYMAVDKSGKELQDYLTLDEFGNLVMKNAIVADRSFWPKPSKPGISSPDTWEWTID